MDATNPNDKTPGSGGLPPSPPPPPVHPYSRANVLSKYFFWWLVPLLRTGLARQIVAEDIYRVLGQHGSDHIGTQFGQRWQEQRRAEKKKKKQLRDGEGLSWKRPWMLLRVVWEIYGTGLVLFGGVYSFLESGCRIVQPFLLGELIRYFDQPTPPPSDGNTGMSDSPITLGQAYLYAGCIVASVMVPVAIFHVYQLYLLQVGMKIRIGCCALIYQKVLQMPAAMSASDGMSGRVINLMSNDVSRFDYAVIFFHDLWKGPVELVIVTVLVFRLMGPTGLIGIVLLLLFIPAEAWLGKKAAGFRMRAALATDERVKFTNEVIQGIQVLKMYVWEIPFEAIVRKLRHNEIRALRGSAFIKSGLFALRVIPKVSIFLSLVTYGSVGNVLTAMRVYMLISFFSVIHHSMVEFWPLAVTSCAEAWVSLKRIQEFLLEPDNCQSKEGEDQSAVGSIVIENVTAGWKESGFAMRSLHWQVTEGQTWAVVGQIGAGKSTLLNLIMQELTPSTGRVTVAGKISYCSQKPWVFEGSVRDNIVFVEPFDEVRYNEVVRVCALERDFKLWPNGDLTAVGERGVTLSGGQKARVNLARAIYRRADIYLLDDPLSAVDAHVGKTIYEECVMKYLESKICVLVTHQLQYLNGLDNVLIMDRGEITARGSYEEVRSYFSALGYGDESKEESVEKVGPVMEDESCQQPQQAANIDEAQMSGNVGFQVYKDFLKSVKNWLFVAFVGLLLIAWQSASTGTDYFVFIWVNWEDNYSKSPDATWTTELHIIVYAILVIITILLFVNSFAFFQMCLRASSNLHAALYRGITRATMYFFNNNASGRIMNRFSKDVGLIDSSLPTVLIDSLYFFLELAGIIVIVSLANYWLLVPTAVMGVVFYVLRFLFLETARNVKRVEAITRSPVFTHTNATIEGLGTIRAFGAGHRMAQVFDARQDSNTSASFLFGAITRGFAFWLDVICSLYIATVVFSFLVLGTEIVSGNVGLAITQVLNLIGMCNWGLRQTAELENQMTSVERVLEYSALEPEQDVTEPAKEAVPDSWPEEGGIVFRNVSLRYSAKAEPVLKDLSFEIKPKERIGIVGRTGAGKSSIIQALFRLAPTTPASHQAIEIDRIRIGSVPLRRHRGAISIIPQDPVIFSGSLRHNLDPAGTLEDDRIWHALEQVELRHVVEATGGGLDTRMAEGGTNFSAGQRQLLCLARAILRNSRILVMDEATASVDPGTDQLIQLTIREQFQNCTIVTIAHRLHTVMDSDRILVMDAGRLVEFDSPANLLLQSGGYFRRLFDESGMDGRTFG